MRGRGGGLLASLAFRHLKKKARNSWAATQDTYLSTKEIFENHKVVFTVGTSIASVATAWAGYTLRHYHESKVDRRLQSIEDAIQNNVQLERLELRKLVDPGHSRAASWFATIGTTFFIGYGFGWRGGRWFANRKYEREQMKLLGQMKPSRWQLLRQIKASGWLLPGQIKPRGLPFQIFRRRLTRSKATESAAIASEKRVAESVSKTSERRSLDGVVEKTEKMQKDVSTTPNSGALQQTC